MNGFKVWCGEKDEWEDDPVLMSEHGNIYHFINNRTKGQLMQLSNDTHKIFHYIGIKAEDGTELKEGDIVKRHSGEDYVVRLNQIEAKFQIERIGDNYPVDFMELNVFHETLKIIGHECERKQKR
jgi:endo-beta-N-acetylglucosaminidase D